MKSRKKKKNNSRIFIAFGKGIASVEAIGLAMLFSHAGFDLYPLFLKGASDWVSYNAVTEISKNSIAGENNSTEQPKWLFQNAIKFDVAIIVNPSHDELSYLLDDKSLSSAFLGVKQRILQAFVLTDYDYEFNEKQSLFFRKLKLPEDKRLYRDFYTELFSSVVSYIALKKTTFSCSYKIEDMINSPMQIKLINALSDKGVIPVSEFKNNSVKGNIFIKLISDTSFSVLLNEKKELFADYLSNGLIVKANDETRFIPEVKGQLCLDRFLSYLLTELTRLNEPC